MSANQINAIKMNNSTGYNTRSKCQMDDFYVKCRDIKEKMDAKTFRQYNTRLQKRLKKEQRAEVVARQTEAPYVGMVRDNEPWKMLLRKRVLLPVSEVEDYDEYDEADEAEEADDYDSSSDYTPSEDEEDDEEYYEDEPNYKIKSFSKKIPSDYISQDDWPVVDEGDNIMQSKYQTKCFVSYMGKKIEEVKKRRTTSRKIKSIISLFQYLSAIFEWMTTEPEFRRLGVRFIPITVTKTLDLMKEIKDMLENQTQDIPNAKDLHHAYYLVLNINEKFKDSFSELFET
jgi:hypothetical protein